VNSAIVEASEPTAAEMMSIKTAGIMTGGDRLSKGVAQSWKRSTKSREIKRDKGK